jgi:hypothetical protein
MLARKKMRSLEPPYFHFRLRCETSATLLCARTAHRLQQRHMATGDVLLFSVYVDCDADSVSTKHATHLSHERDANKAHL